MVESAVFDQLLNYSLVLWFLDEVDVTSREDTEANCYAEDEEYSVLIAFGGFRDNSSTLAGEVARQRLRLIWGSDNKFVFAARTPNSLLFLNWREMKSLAAFRTVHVRHCQPLSYFTVDAITSRIE